MTDVEIIKGFFAILDRHSLADGEAGVLAGVAQTTIRVIRLSKTLPKRAHCRHAIQYFVARNVAAKTRSDLRLPDDAAFRRSA